MVGFECLVLGFSTFVILLAVLGPHAEKLATCLERREAARQAKAEPKAKELEQVR